MTSTNIEVHEKDEVFELMLSKDENEVKINPSNEPEEEDSIKKSHDQKIRYLVTSLICISFLCLGICDTVIGPTLLDLRDLYETELETISLIILLRAIGSLCGCFLAGYLLDRFQHKRCYIIFTYCAGFGVATCLTPLAGNVPALMLVSLFYGLNSGSIDAGGNVLCLDAWRGLDSGPYLHSIHFMFGIGAFIAPMFAEPFLKEKIHLEENLNAFMSNETISTQKQGNASSSIDNDDYYEICTLYPIIGAFTVLVAFGYLYFAISNPKVIRGKPKKDPELEKEEETSGQRDQKILTYLLVTIMCVFYLLYVGMEVSYGLYIATFSVESQLNLSKSDGAYITAIFWGCFAAMRFVAIFAAVKMRPIYIMTVSFAFCILGSVPLAIWGESSSMVLKVSSAFLGIGMASIYASGILWAEQYIKITNRISAAFVISSSMGADIFPLLLGQTIGSIPMLIMYLQLGTIVICILLFVSTYFIGQKILKMKKSEEEKS